jgi:hypothetical protein
MITHDEIRGWLLGRLPDWFTTPAEITIDRDEILIVGTLPAPTTDSADADVRALARGRIAAFRSETKSQRIEIASELEHLTGLKVSWGARIDDETVIFTSVALPVMTRLRIRERQVLDTLVDGGVARSRADALAWCVRLVGQNSDEWLARLRDALTNVEQVRSSGPDA